MIWSITIVLLWIYLDDIIDLGIVVVDERIKENIINLVRRQGPRFLARQIWGMRGTTNQRRATFLYRGIGGIRVWQSAILQEDEPDLGLPCLTR